MASFAARQVFAAAFLSVVLCGCQASPASPGVAPAASDGQEHTFSLRGKVVSVAGDVVTLDHDAIPGFMGAMTMPYRLADPGVASELHPGDRLVAKVRARQGTEGFVDPRLDDVVVVGQARPDYVPAVHYHAPAAGDAVPDFSLLNQSGRSIHLAQFRGRLLLLTFIYTRCNLADFCPRMSRNFAELNKELSSDPALYAQTHLLSVSFDPSYDTPAVLRSYGGAYTGLYTKENFTHWDFAAPRARDLPAITQFFDVGVTPGNGAALTHSLSTVLVGKDGKVIAWYPTNDWKPADVFARIRQASSSTSS